MEEEEEIEALKPAVASTESEVASKGDSGAQS